MEVKIGRSNMEIKIKRSKLQATISFMRKEGGTWVDMIIVELHLCLFVALSCIDDIVAMWSFVPLLITDCDLG